MSRIRDIANLFSANTSASTDAEVTAAIASHSNATTSVHGITDTSVLATSTSVTSAISTHNSATTSVHGIANTADLATSSSVTSAISTHATAANGHFGRGTTASRPVSPAIGDLYFDTTLNLLLAYGSTGWGGVAPVPDAPTSVSASIQSFGSASVSFTAPANVTTASYTVTSSPGGITQTGTSSPIIVSGLSSNTAYTFSIIATGTNGNSVASSASNSVTTPNPIIDYLVVAGGGGGGDGFAAGGGGGGGYLTGTSFAITPGTLYNVTVGSGGAGATSGNNSVFSSITSIGGGRGGGSFNNNAASGGSGGGTATLNFSSSGGAGTSGQGFRGGNSPSPAYTQPYGGTGGGGAGAQGVDQPSSSGAVTVGGAGLASSITGSSITYAGGGGGGAAGAGTGVVAAGGAGGGGAGGSGTPAGNNPNAIGTLPTAGTANRGGGGGGTAYYAAAVSGGSGIVVLRYPNTYPNPSATSGSPTVANTGGYKIYTFNSTGSITF
jgi:hypothetical protein